MFACKLLVTTLLIIFFTGCGNPVVAGPTVTITSPPDGSVSLTRSVNITGTAPGSDARWHQTSKADFDTGTKENITSDAGGALSLNESLYDDFDDYTLDAAKWQKTTAAGVNCVEEGGAMHFSGRATSSNWAAISVLRSSAHVIFYCSADLLSFSGTGTGYWTGFSLFQDTSNEVSLQVVYDPGQFGNQNIYLYFSYWIGGVYGGAAIKAAAPGPHNYAIEYRGGTAYFYEDGSVQGSKNIALSNMQVHITGCARASGDTIDSKWDNVRIDSVSAGYYISTVCDTLVAFPSFKKVNWTASLPAGSGLSVWVRLSDSPDMSSPTAWAIVSNNQTAGFLAAKRYIQYKVEMTSDGSSTPSLKDITFEYRLPVAKVEVSIDNQNSWVSTVGTANWYARMELPENATLIWVRATDVAGEVTLVSRTINVDTTAPAGSILINDNNTYAGSNNVFISMSANDNYAVDNVILSEFLDFSDADWDAYTNTVSFELSDGDGLKTVYAKFRDANGWESAVVNDSIFLDTGPPRGSILIDRGAEFTRNLTVALSINATDIAGVTMMKLANDKSFQGAVWEPFAKEADWKLPPGNGSRTVYARFLDSLDQQSEVVNDTIILDTSAPLMRVSINGGETYANSSSVSLLLTVTEDYLVAMMQVSEDPSFSGSAWEPFNGNRTWKLSPGDSLKKVYARASDAAGNEGPAGSSTIFLDNVAPGSKILPLPFEVNMTNFTVGWNGSDATSGILFFDVQYNDGGGSWTGWLQRVNSTKAIFSGVDGHTYSFRVRAQDRAGNLENYSDAPGNAVIVRVPVPRLPVVTIMRPIANTTVKGTTYMIGTAFHPEPGMKVRRILVQIDGGPAQPADGTDSWTLELDTTQMVNGRHTMLAQAFDGTRYSNASESAFFVKNQAPAPATRNDGLMLVLGLLAVVLVAAGITAMLLVRKKRSLAAPPQNIQRMPASPGSPAEAYMPIHRPVQPPQVQPPQPAMPAEDSAPPAQAGGKMAVIGKISVDDLDDAPAPKVEKTAEQKQADETAAREGRILKALTSLPRGLPSSLWGMDMDALAAVVAAAERKTNPDGETIIRINTRWYFGDEKNLGSFMQEYKK